MSHQHHDCSCKKPSLTRCNCGCLDVAYEKVFNELPQHQTRSRLAAFLYLLMRDHVPSGTVAELVLLVNKAERSEDSFFLSNGHLAEYAEYLADKVVPQAEEAGE